MLATLLASDSYLGRCLVGRIEQGKINVNQIVKTINLDLGAKVNVSPIFFVFECVDLL